MQLDDAVERMKEALDYYESDEFACVAPVDLHLVVAALTRLRSGLPVTANGVAAMKAALEALLVATHRLAPRDLENGAVQDDLDRARKMAEAALTEARKQEGEK